MTSFEATQPSPPPIPGMPADRIPKFLDRYAKTGSLRAAARSARVPLAAHFEMLETSNAYRRQFEAAQQQLADVLEAEAFRRALGGADSLIIFLLRAWLPARYREHTIQDLTVSEADRAAPEAIRRLMASEKLQ